MNKKDFILKLAEALAAFIVHHELLQELVGELKQSGNEKAFLSVLLKRLKFLLYRGILATEHEEFEPLSDGIYSLHVSGKGFNIRILYGFLSSHRPALLLAFHERAGHRATDYSGKVTVAAQRLAEIEEEQQYGKNM